MSTPSLAAPRALPTLLLLAAAVPCVALLSLAIGANALTPGEVVHALVSPTGAEGDVVVRSLRAPRTALGLLVGAALGAAGVLMQGHTRNAVAEPGLLGVSAGAAVAVVIGLRTGLVDGLMASVVAAAIGAALSSLAVYALARRSAHDGGPGLVVAGAAVTAFLGAIATAVVLLDAKTLDAYRFWAVGSLADRGASTPLVVLPVVVAGLVVALVNARTLDLLTLGDDVAASLGLSVTRARLLGLAAVTTLTAAGVAACGPIAFVGLLAGIVARTLVGPAWTTCLIGGALVGALFLVAADVLGRVIGGPGELQVGVVAGLVGAPLLVAVIRRRGLAL